MISTLGKTPSYVRCVTYCVLQARGKLSPRKEERKEEKPETNRSLIVDDRQSVLRFGLCRATSNSV